MTETTIQRICGHLGAALIQYPDDGDRIIREHIEQAHEMAREAVQREHRDNLHGILGAVLEPEHVSGGE